MWAAESVSSPRRWKTYLTVSPRKRAPARQLIHRDHAGLQTPGHGDDVVVLQVLADARNVGHDLNPMALQQARLADP